MRLLLFSDVHADLEACRTLVRLSQEADAVVGAGDFAVRHGRLGETIAALSAIERPAVLVPGNNETRETLVEACAASWPGAVVLHGEGRTVGNAAFYGVGAGVPPTPFDWSFDLEEAEAARLLEACPVKDWGKSGGVLVLHSPPAGHGDVDGRGRHLGSRAILEAIERCGPALAVCGHVHESWGRESTIGRTTVINAGPRGRLFDL